MALLTGAFLVYSAQSLSVARRRAQFALLRVLGVYRRGLIAQVLTEGAIVGAVGAIIGLAIGLVIADAGLRLLGGDLGGGYFSGTRPQLTFAPWAALTSSFSASARPSWAACFPHAKSRARSPRSRSRTWATPRTPKRGRTRGLPSACSRPEPPRPSCPRSASFRCSAISRSRCCLPAASRQCRCSRACC